MTLRGRPIGTIAQGNYRFRITDHDPKAGVTLKPNGGSPTRLTGAKNTGTKTTIVSLTDGTWSYSAVGKTKYFLVG
jgi:hypothetical protein